MAVWGWVLGLTGAALRFLSNYSAVRRYIADASYWIYLAHLPVVAALRGVGGPVAGALERQVPVHPGRELRGAVRCSYHLLVRPSFIGQLLNGRKYPRRKATGAQAAPRRPAPRRRTAARSPAARHHQAVRQRPPRSPASTSSCAAVSCWRCSARTAPARSTAISLWLGLIEADAGEVTLLGGSPLDIERRRGLGVMMQDVEMYKELKVRELITLASSYYRNPLSVEETLQRAGIAALADRPYGKLSGGQKRQAQFAVAICGRPRVLFLDEPTVGLDVQAREVLWANVRTAARRRLLHRAHHALPRRSRGARRRASPCSPRDASSPPAASTTCARWWRAARSAAKRTLSADEVRGWPGVIEATPRAGAPATSSPPTRKPWCGGCCAEDPALRRLEVREAGLTEAFNELTKEAA